MGASTIESRSGRTLRRPQRSAAATAAQRYGEASHPEQVIRLDVSLGEQRVREVLLHEVLHCCYRMAALDDGDKEERVVEGLGMTLSAVFRDNPDLCAFLMEPS